MRRAVVVLVSMALAVLLSYSVTPKEATEAQGQAKPNIVFVLTDDQFPSTENEMPALKNNITSEGIKFTNMISTFPLCCPGRATIQRGQYAHNTKIYGNALPLGGWEKFQRRREHKSTVATWLNRSNYQTGLFGKYINNYRDRLIPPGWDRWYAWNGPKEGWSHLNDQGHEKPVNPAQADTLVAKNALEFLNHRLDKAAPVFAYISFGAMHSPYYHAKIDRDKFKGVGVPRTPAFNEDDVSDKPSYIRERPPLSESKISELDQDYRNGLRSLMGVDRFIRDASRLLRRKGEMDDTYFVFYTDNGVHFGQHRFGHGKLQPYEEDTNFPLIMRGPGIPRGVSSAELVGNHDIAPTLAQIGGANIPSFVDGRSFLRSARDPNNAPWSRTAILSERETNTDPPNKWDMLRMKSKVYIRHQQGPSEYYDIRTDQDPYQLHNAFRPDVPSTAAKPDPETVTYYEQRLDDLYRCGVDGPVTCKEAEDAPLLPEG